MSWTAKTEKEYDRAPGHDSRDRSVRVRELDHMVQKVSLDKRDYVAPAERKKRMIRTTLLRVRSQSRFDEPGFSFITMWPYSKSWSLQISTSYSWENVL